MAYPISAFLARLQECNGSVTRGSYTPTTLGQLAQNLSRLVFALPGGILVVSEGEQPRAWAEVALREVMVPVRRVGLPAAPAQGRGFALIGLGAELGFVLAATPTDTASLDQTTQLYDTRWSLDPSAVGALAMLASDALPGGLAAGRRGLRLPAAHELLQLSAATLDFAARQHATLVVTARALNDRLRHHEDQTRMIVHDMRAPLHTLLICLRTLQRQRFDPEGQHELLAVASESAASTCSRSPRRCSTRRGWRQAAGRSSASQYRCARLCRRCASHSNWRPGPIRRVSLVRLRRGCRSSGSIRG